MGLRIRHYRKLNKITQEELADKSEISLQFMGMIERGERSASIETLTKIANSLGVKLINLFDFDDETIYYKIRDKLLEIVKKENIISNGKKLIFDIFSILNEYEKNK